MQVMEAPVRVLRGLAAGAGKIIGVADRRKAKAARADVPETAPAEAGAPETTAAEASGNVAVVTPETAMPETVDATAPEAPAEAASAEAASTEAASAEAVPAEAVPAKAVAEAPAVTKPTPSAAKKAAKPKAAAKPAAELPLANYDELTVNSLRARMTKLSPDELTVLIDYEKAHQGRDDVVGMLERRITRINSGQTTSFQAVK